MTRPHADCFPTPSSIFDRIRRGEMTFLQFIEWLHKHKRWLA